MARLQRHGHHAFIDPQTADRNEGRAMHTPDASSTLNGQASPRWQQALMALRPPVWVAIVGAPLALGMLLAFEQVVARSVAQSALRHQAIETRAEGTWRCKLLRDARGRDQCLARVAAE
jgi:hypothetical protein